MPQGLVGDASFVRDWSFEFQVPSFKYDPGISAIRNEQLETRNMKLETRRVRAYPYYPNGLLLKMPYRFLEAASCVHVAGRVAGFSHWVFNGAGHEW